MRIAVENSTWNNIGDAFYQTALQTMVGQAFPEAEVFAFDGPIVRAFRPRNFKANAYDARPAVDADHFIFSGPILGSTFPEQYGPLIKAIVESGRSYSLVSVHAYSKDEELDRLREFLKAYPPRAIETRDRVTFDKIRGLADCQKDGVCFAFFVRCIPGVPLYSADERYICMSFHSAPEPKVRFEHPGAGFFEAGIDLSQEVQPLLPWKFSRHLDFAARRPTEVAGRKVVRPVHSFYPSPHLIFSRPNSYISYNPANFLSIYRNCEGVITDRVHAGVAALSFGKPALVSRLDGRYALFEKVPLERNGDVVRLAPAALDKIYDEHMDWLRTDFRAAIVH
jgi:hypothetical protein